VNAQNWQTIPDVLAPLRDLGTPAAAIVDLDAIRGGGADWSKFYRLMRLSDAERDAIGQQRASSKAFLDAVPEIDGVRRFKTHGIGALPVEQRQPLRELLKSLSEHGVFVVPVGELERWLSQHAIVGKKARWVVNAFQVLGDDPSSVRYVHPGSGDVWRFIDGIASGLQTRNGRGRDKR